MLSTGQEHAAITAPNPSNLAAWYVENQGNRLVFFNDAGGNPLHSIQRAQPLP